MRKVSQNDGINRSETSAYMKTTVASQSFPTHETARSPMRKKLPFLMKL